MPIQQVVRVVAMCGLLVAAGCAGGGRGTMEIRAVPTVPADGPGALYVCNRPPLLPSPLVKLPIGSITPRGWLRGQLELAREGMIGRLPEISRWCNFEGNAWADPEGTGHSGWEEMPYWLKGYGDLGYVLKDQKVIDLTKRWVEAILATQREDGWFGPRGLLTSLNGKPDLWPNMIVLNILQSWYEYTNDPRVLPFMTRYFRWQLNFPEEDFMVGYWPHIRAGDNIESVYWLYNRTGDKWLLDVAAKIHRRMARWDHDVINWHGVNIAQGFRAPGVYYMQSQDPAHLKAAHRNYDKVMEMYGQFPGGMFVADENARPGYSDPRGAAETCSMVEFMHSFEMLTKISGEAIWADRCEDVAFNSFPASLTPDLKGLHYLTSANQVQLDKGNKAPGVQNGGTMFSYSPFQCYRCCQHNVSHGWPYYAEELWLATADRGLCASLYAPSEVVAKVGDGRDVCIVQSTDYPFSDTITFRIRAINRGGRSDAVIPPPLRFPLYLRIPSWADRYELKVNGQAMPTVTTSRGFYVVIERDWRLDDVVELRLPMSVRTRTWEKNQNAVSVEYGPLSFSLKIGEKWVKYGSDPAWPEWEVYPTTPWNYGLVEKAEFEVVRRPGAIARQPFTPEAAPIAIRAQARKIPQWTQDATGLINPLQMSPVKSGEPVENVWLIPMGCARLRISAFPTVSDSPDAREWTAPPKPPTASHCFESDTVLALSDGKLPRSSSDGSIPRFTWWPHKGGTEWAQYEFARPRTVKGVEVYWFDDTGKGFCRVPESWRVLYRDGGQWKPVADPGEYGKAVDRFNKTTFGPVTTDGLRVEVKLQGQYSGGILEWRVIE